MAGQLGIIVRSPQTYCELIILRWLDGAVGRQGLDNGDGFVKLSFRCGHG